MKKGLYKKNILIKKKKILSYKTIIKKKLFNKFDRERSISDNSKIDFYLKKIHIKY